MATVDYERAWYDLQERIQERESGWGTKNLLAEMADVAVANRVSEGLFERFLRLYGGRLFAFINPTEAAPSVPGGTTPPRDAVSPDDSKTEEVANDGSSTGTPQLTAA